MTTNEGIEIATLGHSGRLIISKIIIEKKILRLGKGSDNHRYSLLDNLKAWCNGSMLVHIVSEAETTEKSR